MSTNFNAIKKTINYSELNKKMLKAFSDFILQKDEIKIKLNNLKSSVKFIDSKSTFKICPEPITFINEVQSKKTIFEKIDKFNEKSKTFKELTFDRPEDGKWINTTNDGINLRLGNYEFDKERFDPMVLGDELVHGVIVGRTGSGKSVLINNIIMNLLYEYAPWELDLYFIDMKKVELSKYMKTDRDTGRYLTPHIMALGATSEISYVVSILEKVYLCMQERQNLFASLDVKKIKEFRDKYNMCLPRILILIDEFQQLFEEATNKERLQIDEYITSITKLGRATGVHILCASQDMSGALGSKELANFKLRIALPCDSNVSSYILGNDAASKINEKGITLVNNKGGSGSNDNIKYRTPYINDNSENGEDSEFDRHLKIIFNQSRKTDFIKNQQYYNEDHQENVECIESVKKSENVLKQYQSLKGKNLDLYDFLVMGTEVIYTGKKNNLKHIMLEFGKKRNIAVVCDEDEKLFTIVKTLKENFKHSVSNYAHKLVILNKNLSSSVRQQFSDITTLDDDNAIEQVASKRKNNMQDIFKDIDYSDSKEKCFKKLILNYVNLKSEESLDEQLKKLNYDKNYDKAILEKTFSEICNMITSGKSIYEFVGELLNITKENVTKQMSLVKDNNTIGEDIAYNILLTQIIQEMNPSSINCLYENKLLFDILNKSLENKVFTPIVKVNWIIGTENVEASTDRVLSDILENATNNFEVFILVGKSTDSLSYSYKNCNYIFVNSNNDSIYNFFRIDKVENRINNVNAYSKIVNFNEQFIFKMFYCKSGFGGQAELSFEDVEY